MDSCVELRCLLHRKHSLGYNPEMGNSSFHCSQCPLLVLQANPRVILTGIMPCSLLNRYMIYKYFLPFCWLSFYSLDGGLRGTKVFHFDEVQFVCFFLWLFVPLVSDPRKSLPNPIS